MKNLLLATALMLAATPAFAKDFTIKEVTDPNGGKNPYYFSPDKLTIQPGDTVTFENAQDDTHDVMFVGVPKAVDEMIMSPTMEKQGQKWSYKFTVPGTYQFHCHPHEELGMKGTIIVGAPSKAGETKEMDHHKMGQKLENAAAVPSRPQGTGKVMSVDAANRSIKLDHEPIKALDWPRMKMSFTVDKDIDLSSFKEGDAVSFKLNASGKNDYTIVELQKK